MRVPSHLLIISIILAAGLLTACSLSGRSAPTTVPTLTPAPTEEANDSFFGSPNPASFYCLEMGYELEIRETDQGEAGFCLLPDGQECEEWDFLQGRCGKVQTFCERQGYILESGEEGAVCTFPDGSSCPEYEFFIGECQAPEN